MNYKRTHQIKLNYNFCDVVLNGIKTFEVRLNDRFYQTGDIVQFIPIDKGMLKSHPIEQKAFVITYVLHGYGLEDRYVCFGIRPIGD